MDINYGRMPLAETIKRLRKESDELRGLVKIVQQQVDYWRKGNCPDPDRAEIALQGIQQALADKGEE